MVKPWRTRILGMCSASAVACAVGILPATMTNTGSQGPTAQAAESTQWTNPSARDGHSKNDIDVSISQINPTIATIDGHVAFTEADELNIKHARLDYVFFVAFRRRRRHRICPSPAGG